MGLPKLESPTFELTIPSTNKVIKYRPFLVKEQKILYVSMQGKDNNELQIAETAKIGYSRALRRELEKID